MYLIKQFNFATYLIGFIYFTFLSSNSIFAQNNLKLITNLGHANDIASVAFSPNGKLAASGGKDAKIIIWHVQSGRELQSFTGHEKEVTSLAFLDDYNLLSASFDKTIRKWNLKTGKEVKKIEDSSSYPFRKLEVSKELFITLDNGGRVKIWDRNTFKLLKAIEEKNNRIVSVVFNNDKSKFLTVHAGKTSKIWDAKNLEIINANYISLEGTIRFSPNGKKIATFTDKTVKLWDVASAKNLWTSEKTAYFIKQVSFSPDGKHLVVNHGLKSYTAMLLDAETGKSIREYKYSFRRGYCLDVSPDGKYIIAGGDQPVLKLWSLNSGQLLREFGAKVSPVLDMAMSKDGSRMAVSHHDKSLKVWDMEKVKFNWGRNSTIGGPGFRELTFNDKGDKILNMGWKGKPKIEIWGADRGTSIKSINYNEGTSITIPLAINDNEKVIVSTDYEKLKIQFKDLASGKILKEIKAHSKDIVALKLTNNNSKIVSSSQDETIKIWDAKKGSKIKTIKIDNGSYYNNTVIDLAISPDDQFIVAAFRNQINVYNLNTGKLVSNTNSENGEASENAAILPQGIGEITSLDISPDGRFIVIGGKDNTVKIRDFKSGDVIKVLQGHNNSIVDVFFHDNGKKIVSGSEDGTVKLWDVTTGKTILNFISQNNSAAYLVYTPDGYYMGSKDGLNAVHFSDRMKPYAIDQFDLKFNRPDIILSRLGNQDQKLIDTYKKAWEKRVSKMGFSVQDFEGDYQLNVPEAEIEIDPSKLETSEPQFDLSIKAHDKLYPLNKLFITINGVPIFGKDGKGIPAKNPKYTSFTEKIDLVYGHNLIKVSVSNSKGAESLTEEFDVVYTPSVKSLPNLHIITIGVSKFKDSAYNLTYADKDAKDFVNAMKQKNGLYKEVFEYSFLNENAKREDILKVKEQLQKTNPNDHVMVFIASHGLLDRKLDYYIALHETDFINPSDHGLSYESLDNILDGIPARNKLMFIDACHSGEVDKDSQGSESGNSLTVVEDVNSRGFKGGVGSAKSIGLQSSFELMKHLFADLRKGNGTIVISSASGKEFAFESSEWKNGVFTYSLLKGIKEAKADFNKDGKIYINELRRFIFSNVAALTNGKQHPTVRTENISNNFRVY